MAILNAVVLAVVAALFTLYALLPFAMANDDPASGPLVRHGVLQLLAYGGLIAWAVVGVVVAWSAGDHAGWAAVGVGAAGWGVWIGGVVATMAVFFLLARLDTALGGR
ncbi:hypothetical protein ACR9E3_14035 [Actinomycetospora sp. C-140]